MVSAANSFGLMDGGVDLAITNFFGVDLMDRVQAHILRDYLGEQPIRDVNHRRDRSSEAPVRGSYADHALPDVDFEH